MAMQFSKEDLIYNRSIADMGVYLVINKILPNELSLIHYDIVTNIEMVDINSQDDISNAREIMKDTYNKLKNHWKFKNKIEYDGDKITLLKE